jgi:pyruvyl transferase EpsO
MESLAVVEPSAAVQMAFRERLSTVVDNKRVAYVDTPIHKNFGDTLIYLGARRLLSLAGAGSVNYFSAHEVVRNPDILGSEDPEVILLHGGGNFGDLYELHQEVRRLVVDTYPHRDKLLMPQSVHYGGDVGSRDRQSFSNARNFTVFVRDHVSRTLMLEEFGLDAELWPDTAHVLSDVVAKHLPSPTVTREDRLFFLRKDTEISEANPQELDAVRHQALDWVDFFSSTERFRIRWTPALLRSVARAPGLLARIHRSWAHSMEAKLADITHRFAGYSHCTTDRLHGAIFASMVGLEVKAYDNSYGKLSRYFAALEELNATYG